jgi:hypothetical protein
MIRRRLALWRIIPHRWMTRPCPGPPSCAERGPHTADTTAWFRLAYGTAR